MELFISKKSKSISTSPTLAIDAKFKAMKANGEDVVGFGAGEPDFDTPEHIKNAAVQAIMSGKTKYTPASGLLELRQAICRKLLRDNSLEYTPAQIVVSNGAKHSLVNIFTAICNPGDEVIIPVPYWVSYPEMVKLADGVPVFVDSSEADNFKVTAQAIEKAITPRTRAIILNSPSNPTGMIYTRDELQAIANVAVKHNIYVVSDEIYEHLTYNGKHTSIAELGEDIKNLTIIVNGVSKTFAMTGWRIGYTACDKSIAEAMGNVQSHATSNPNTIAQWATIAALDGEMDCVEEMRTAFSERCDYMVEQMNKIDGVSCLKPDGAFYVMMNIADLLGKTFYNEKVDTADRLAEMLLEKVGLALVPSTGFGVDHYMRWSYATSMENIKEGLGRLKKFLSCQS